MHLGASVQQRELLSDTRPALARTPDAPAGAASTPSQRRRNALSAEKSVCFALPTNFHVSSGICIHRGRHCAVFASNRLPKTVCTDTPNRPPAAHFGAEVAKLISKVHCGLTRQMPSQAEAIGKGHCPAGIAHCWGCTPDEPYFLLEQATTSICLPEGDLKYPQDFGDLRPYAEHCIDRRNELRYCCAAQRCSPTLHRQCKQKREAAGAARRAQGNAFMQHAS
eukprot:6211838-Pleurochrysis_carterae.AAC.2